MACRLAGTKPLSEPMLEYCQLDPWEQINLNRNSHISIQENNAFEYIVWIMSVILSRPQCVNSVMIQVLAWRICVVPGRQELTLNACLSDDSAYLLGYIHRHRGRPSIEWSGGRFFCLYSRLPHLEDKGHRWLVILNSYKASAWIWTMRMDERETDTTWIMMTSSNGNIFDVTDLMCGEFTGPRCIPLTKASDAEF